MNKKFLASTTVLGVALATPSLILPRNDLIIPEKPGIIKLSDVKSPIIPAYFPLGMIGAGESYDPAAVALFARMSSQPDDARKKVISDTIVALKAAGIWSKLDALYLFAAHTSQASLLNWISSTYDATSTGTFTADRGISAGTNAINTNFTPSTAPSPNYTLNNAHISLWSRSNSDSGGYDFGNSNNSSPYTLLTIRSGNRMGGNLNNSGSEQWSSSVITSSVGHFLSSRSNSSNFQMYKDGIFQATGTATTTGMPTSTLRLANYNQPSPNRQYASASIGGSLNGTEVSNFASILQTYMTAVGA